MSLKYFSKYVVKDFFVFVEEIKHIGAKNSYLSSFDIKSLFTSILLEEVIKNVLTIYKV